MVTENTGDPTWWRSQAVSLHAICAAESGGETRWAAISWLQRHLFKVPSRTTVGLSPDWTFASPEECFKTSLGPRWVPVQLNPHLWVGASDPCWIRVPQWPGWRIPMLASIIFTSLCRTKASSHGWYKQAGRNAGCWVLAQLTSLWCFRHIDLAQVFM